MSHLAGQEIVCPMPSCIILYVKYCCQHVLQNVCSHLMPVISLRGLVEQQIRHV